MIILMRIVPSRTVDVLHQNFRRWRQRGSSCVFLCIRFSGSGSSGFVGSMTHPFMTRSSNKVVEAQRILGTIQ
jgi:hypothetical protein